MSPQLKAAPGRHLPSWLVVAIGAAAAPDVAAWIADRFAGRPLSTTCS
jgi:hypothetical protein